MTNIEERARQFNFNPNLTTDDERLIARLAYKHGAIEQHNMDVGKACMWIHSHLTQYFADQSLRDKVLNEFIQAMNE